MIAYDDAAQCHANSAIFIGTGGLETFASRTQSALLVLYIDNIKKNFQLSCL